MALMPEFAGTALRTSSTVFRFTREFRVGDRVALGKYKFYQRSTSHIGGPGIKPEIGTELFTGVSRQSFIAVWEAEQPGRWA